MPSKHHPEERLMPHTDRLRDRVLAMRKTRNVTDRELAAEMGFSQPAATNFMRGHETGRGVNYEHGKRLEGWLEDEGF